jgi:hypothetical protein
LVARDSELGDLNTIQPSDAASPQRTVSHTVKVRCDRLHQAVALAACHGNLDLVCMALRQAGDVTRSSDKEQGV